MRVGTAKRSPARPVQFLLGLACGFLPLLIEAGDLAESIPAALYHTIEAMGCLAYCAALFTALTCLISGRGRPTAFGLIVGLAFTTALAGVWAVLALAIAN
jgi:hypothetical protein